MGSSPRSRTDALQDGNQKPVKMDPLIFADGSHNYHRLGETVGKGWSIGKKK